MSALPERSHSDDLTPVLHWWDSTHLCFHLSEWSEEIFLFFMGETSVTVEHCCPALPSVWVRRDSLSQDREKQLLPRHHHSLCPWQGLWLLDPYTAANPPDPLLLLHLQHRGFAEQQRSSLQDAKGACTSVPFLHKRKHVLACIWAQITAKKGNSSPAFPMRYVSAESSIPQEP